MNDDDFEWHPRKAIRNYVDHGISFNVAREVFDDPGHIDVPDDRDDYGEDRFVASGRVKDRILVVAYTLRGTGFD